jgi:serpin B
LSTTDRLVAANTRFGFKLFSEIAKQDAGKNVFLSPFSVAAALAMTYNGACGKTQRAMADALELKGMSLQEINEANAALRAALESIDPQVQLVVANSLWLKHGETFKPEFVQRGRSFYDAEVANFGDGDAPVINGWVSRKTQDKIKELVTDDDVAMSILMLINAIYFKGNWTTQFDKAKTHEGEFTQLNGNRKKHPMMSQSGSYRHCRGNNFQAISLPYGGGRVSIYIFLPDQQSSLIEFQKQLTAKNWDTWKLQFRQMQGTITLPRFKVEYEIKLNETLGAIGLGIAFDSQKADFSEMTSPPTFISEVKHKTFLEVNEEGAKAAAATVVEVMLGGLPKTFTMIIDRPFFCAIRDNETGTLLFMGSIVDPQ